MIFWWILLGVGIAIVLHFLVIFLALTIKTIRNFKGKHHCNDCKQSFLIDIEKNYKFCPLCGKELTYYYKDERYIKNSFDTDLSKIENTEEKLK